jgi:hypothetical protein
MNDTAQQGTGSDDGGEGLSKQERFVCTQDTPWQANFGRAMHPDAVSDGDDDDYGSEGSYARYRCPHCGLRFREELPQ